MRNRRTLAMNLDAVAQKAGVSTSTVSRVLNNLEIVKTSTRSRVLKAAEELNYHPNLHARSLARGKSRILGIIVSNMENPFFLDIYRTLEADAHAQGLEVVVANTDYRSEQLVASVQLMIGLRVAGLAVIVSEMEEHLIQTVSSSRIPAAFYDVGTPQKNITNIRVDYRKGIKKTVSYLNALGHRRMAFVGHHSTLGPISERRKTFLESVHRCSPGAEPRIFAGPDGLDGGRQAARELLESGFRPTAILCVNDFMAVGVMRELREEGLQIPRDVSVTGFDNIKLAEFCSPSLTTVHIPREQIGHIIFDNVAGNGREERNVGREFVIDPELVVRDSTGTAPKN
ncbi:MAG TPA: LacI family DNA-binding transcriptional regulator [Terriglobia bacterium]|jgi:LacI family transcriptional regulator, galactose operon repressor|nr:LacI family DNA-binding transcriptional regulator [Terriglobia bacterium]